jgi:hypothetical protein
MFWSLRMTHSVSFPLALVALLVAAPSQAQTTPLRLDDLIQMGQKIEVIDDQGRETKGRVSVLSDTSVTISADRQLTVIPFAHITRIARPNDSLANGALIGFGTGAALGLLAATAGSCDGEIGCFEGPGWVAYTTLLMGAMGAGVGVGIDALIRRDRIVYPRKPRPQARLAPAIGPGVRGVVLGLTW